MKNRNTVYQNDIDLIKKQNMDIENQSKPQPLFHNIIPNLDTNQRLIPLKFVNWKSPNFKMDLKVSTRISLSRAKDHIHSSYHHSRTIIYS